MNIPLEAGDKVISTQHHEGRILIFTEYGDIWYLEIGSSGYYELRKA